MVELIFDLHVSAAQAETETSGDSYDDYDEDDLPDYIFNDTDATEEREKSSQPAILVESNEIPEDTAAEEEEEDATRDIELENIELDATREGKILGGSSVKSLDEGTMSREEKTMSREEVVLNSEEAIKDASALPDEEAMKMGESTSADEKAEKAKEPEALSSTAPPSFVAFSSLMSVIAFLTILTSNSISSLAICT